MFCSFDVFLLISLHFFILKKFTSNAMLLCDCDGIVQPIGLIRRGWVSWETQQEHTFVFISFGNIYNVFKVHPKGVGVLIFSFKSLRTKEHDWKSHRNYLYTALATLVYYFYKVDTMQRVLLHLNTVLLHRWSNLLYILKRKYIALCFVVVIKSFSLLTYLIRL